MNQDSNFSSNPSTQQQSFNPSVSLESTQSLLKTHQSFFGNGKLLLTGEYLVMKGAKALALPTYLGQNLNITYDSSYEPKLSWKSLNAKGEVWFSAEFEFWHFNILESTDDLIAQNLMKILKQARKQNPHFLREDVDVKVETKLEFPIEWGLGSSSTLVYNIAQWAYVSPFELFFKCFNGSGYDIACAGSDGPILYENNSASGSKKSGPNWKPINFYPKFKDHLFFLYLEKKQNTESSVSHFLDTYKDEDKNLEMVSKISKITDEVASCSELNTFNTLIEQHENLLSNFFQEKGIKESLFSDFPGSMKSLGAWGGDFCLVTVENLEKLEWVKGYFLEKSYSTLIPFSDLILNSRLKSSKKRDNSQKIH